MAQENQGVRRYGDTPDELDRYMKEQMWEYSHFVAATDIYVGSALAFTAGSPVPKSTVEAQNWEKMGLVTRVKPADEPKPPAASAPPAPKEGK